ncbi:MAG: OsmC family peroxiredoxin [Candidatus Kapaibacterium sp.]|nr:MAG: OsmC family peroxiredoxin [Candidatus Kapabacteria bacterium]
MVNIHINYEGDLHCRLEHEPSNTVIATDAPTDNHGRGESFSPTDLVAAAMGSCMVTTMAIASKNRNLDLAGTSVQVAKEMASSPRRIGRLVVNIVLPAHIQEEDFKFLENAALTCPVHRSMHPDTVIDFTMRIAGKA